MRKMTFKTLFLVLLLLSGSYVFSQPSSIILLENTYYQSDYTIPSYTELCRSATSGDQTEQENAIANLKPSDMPYNVVMNIYGDPTTQMAFNWFTNAGITGGKVQIVQGVVYNEIDFANPLEFNATCTHVNNLNYNVSGNNLNNLAGIANNTQKSYTENKALATGLSPNTTYSFRVGKESYWSEIGTFTTDKNDKDAFSFIYTTDSQPYIYDQIDLVQRASHAAFSLYPNANFWLHCGDLCEAGEPEPSSEWEWEQFFEKQQDIFLKYPFAPIIGNHDNSTYQNFTKHFYTNSPVFDNVNVPGSTYTFVYGNALFFAINSEEFNNSAYTGELINWMKNEAAKHTDIKWRIVYFHKAMYTGSGWYQNESSGKAWRNLMAPVFDELEIDLALQGHNHIYQVIGPVKNKQLVQGAAFDQQAAPIVSPDNITGKLGGTYNTQEGTLYFLNGSFGEYKYPPLLLNQMNNEGATGISNYSELFTGRFGHGGDGVPTFSNITVTTDTIFITTHELDNNSTQLFDEIKIVKPDFVVDGKLLSIITESGELTSSEHVKVLIKNNGSSPLTGFDLILELNGVEIATETFTGTISRWSQAEYTFTVGVNLSAVDSYEIKVTLDIEYDENLQNNSKTKNIANFSSEIVEMFAYRIWDEDKYYDFVSFNSENPSNIINTNNYLPMSPSLYMCAGEYVDGYFYSYTVKDLNGTPNTFVKISTDTWNDVSSTAVSQIALDMAYDYTTDVMYGIAPSGSETNLVIINMATGAVTTMGSLGRTAYTLACSPEGNLFVVDSNGNFCMVNKTTGTTTVIGSTGLSPYYWEQSMAFDQITGRLFWAYINVGGEGRLIEISPKSGVVLDRGKIGKNAELIGLYTTNTYTITASINDGNGSISPSGTTTVNYWGSQTYTITPNTGYYISQVLVNGINNPAAVSSGSYTFTNVTDNQTIAVTFATNIINVSSVVIEPATLSLEVGQTKMLKAIVEPAHATNKTVIWSSSDINIAKVDVITGEIIAISTGSATITATTQDGNKISTCIVMVDKSTDIATYYSPLVKLYPNPTSGLFTMNFNTTDVYHVTITDLNGNILFFQTVSNQMKQMDISSYPAGVYLMVIDDGKQKRITKIVKYD